MNLRFARPAIIFTGAAAVLAACGHSAPTRFFTLDALPPSSSPASAYAGTPLQLDSVRIPAVLDRPDLVREFAADQLQVDDFSQWGAPLGQLMNATLTQDLIARLPGGRVVVASTPRSGPVLGLSVDILAVNEGAGQLSINVVWTLTPPPPPPPQPSHLGPSSRTSFPAPPTSHTLRLSTPTADAGPAAHAAALSRLLAQLADAIANQVQIPPA